KQNRAGLFGGSQSSGVSPTDRKALSNAFRSFVRNGDESELKAMSVGSDPDGGYLVLPAFDTALMKTVFETSPIRNVARVVQISQSDAFEQVLDKDEADVSWVAETGSRAVTDSPQIQKIRIPVHELYASPKLTQTLLDDS